MKKAVAIAAAAAGFLAVAGSSAGAAPTDVEIARLQALQHVTSVNVIDTALWGDRHVQEKRWMRTARGWTPLQQAILAKTELMDLIQRHVWSFDLKSVYALTVMPSGRVVIYLGDPPA
jgi:hypothetical protein